LTAHSVPLDNNESGVETGLTGHTVGSPSKEVLGKDKLDAISPLSPNSEFMAELSSDSAVTRVELPADSIATNIHQEIAELP
jgi:hypothetical protein